MQGRILRGGETVNSFEQVYPAYEFSELVRLGVALAQWLVVRQKRGARLAEARL